MKITAQIPGSRNTNDITVPVSLDGTMLTFDVPTVQRANACTFSVDLTELQAAIAYLTPSEGPDPRAAGIREAVQGRDAT